MSEPTSDRVPTDAQAVEAVAAALVKEPWAQLYDDAGREWWSRALAHVAIGALVDSDPPFVVWAEHADALRESLARMVRWTEVDAEYMSTAELAEYGDDLRAARALLGEAAS